ncbi:MAG: glycosyltransferase family 39 protein [Kofleriaceae bacterium]
MTGPASREATRWQSWAIAGALIGVVAWSCWQRWVVLTESPFPVGIDGYFYPIQLRSLLENGSLVYPSSPLALWLMAPLAAITDPITGAKLGAAIGGASIALPMYAVGARLGRHRGAGLIAAALATTSAGSMYLTFEYVKNGIGLTIAVTALWLVLRALEGGRRRAVIAVIGIVAAVLTHKMAGGLVLVIAGPAVVSTLVAHPGRARSHALVAIGAAIVVAAIAGLALPTRFLSPSDLALFDGLLQPIARWTAPALVLPNTTLAMGYEAAIGGVLAMIVAVHWIIAGPMAASPGDRAATIAIVALSVVTALPWLGVDDPQGLGFRVRIAAFVPMALCAALVSRIVVEAVTRLWARRSSMHAAPAGALVVIALAIVAGMPARRTDGRITAHPALVTACEALAGRVPPGDTVIVPERHIAFMAAWYARVSVQLRPDSVPHARRWRLVSLWFIRAGSALDAALLAAREQPTLIAPVGLHPRHPNGLVLVAEPTWDWIVAQLPTGEQRRLAAWPTI